MQIDIFYKNIENKKEKDFITGYLEDKKGRFEKLTDNIDYEVGRLEVKAERFATKAAYKIELALHLPKKKYLSSEDDHTLREAIDLAVDKMMIQLRKDRNRVGNKIGGDFKTKKRDEM